MEMNGSANCLIPGVDIGEYRLEGVVGEGGFGIVYKARDLSLDRVVAIKEYMPLALAGRTASNQIHVRSQHRGAFEAGLRSFINEARLLAKFSHPALVHVYRFFEENSTAYMVMRYYEGQTLGAFLTQHQSAVDERWLSTILSPILDVLEMLHATDCYHRDIAPDNIFLQNSGIPVLLDFGAARRIIGDLTQALTMVLKPGFAPIEQYVDDGAMQQGAWTDIYQLGAVLYLAITGKIPATSVARMINDQVGVLTCENYPKFSETFLQGVHHALAVKPQDRPQTIAALRESLGLSSFASAISWGSGSNTTSVQPVSVPIPGNQPVLTQKQNSPSQASSQSRNLDVDVSKQDTRLMDPIVISTSQGGEKSTDVEPFVDGANPAASVFQKINRWHIGIVCFFMIVGLGIFWNQNSSSVDTLELQHWELAARTDTAEALQSYLDIFPEGLYHTEAKNRLVELEVKAAEFLQQQGQEVVSEPASGSNEGVSPENIKLDPVLNSNLEGVAEPVDSQDVPVPVKPIPVVQGGVILRISPWGNVMVNRTLIGTTPPLTQLDLPEGEHRIEITNPAAQSVVKVVRVKKDAPVILSHKFE